MKKIVLSALLVMGFLNVSPAHATQSEISCLEAFSSCEGWYDKGAYLYCAKTILTGSGYMVVTYFKVKSSQKCYFHAPYLPQ